MTKKLQLSRESANCEAVRYRTPHVKSGVKIGLVCKVDGGYTWKGDFSSGTFKAKTKAQAIHAIVRQRQINLNLDPGRVRLEGTKRRKKRGR